MAYICGDHSGVPNHVNHMLTKICQPYLIDISNVHCLKAIIGIPVLDLQLSDCSVYNSVFNSDKENGGVIDQLHSMSRENYNAYNKGFVNMFCDFVI
jgi:hypothetical protein